MNNWRGDNEISPRPGKKKKRRKGRKNRKKRRLDTSWNSRLNGGIGSPNDPPPSSRPLYADTEPDGRVAASADEASVLCTSSRVFALCTLSRRRCTHRHKDPDCTNSVRPHSNQDDAAESTVQYQHSQILQPAWCKSDICTLRYDMSHIIGPNPNCFTTLSSDLVHCGATYPSIHPAHHFSTFAKSQNQ